MELILLENVIKLGKIGDKVKVKNGYGRNFLLKTGKALRSSKENFEFVNKKKDELNKINNEKKKGFKDLAIKINNKTLTFQKEAKENGELYGSIKPKEISSAFSETLKVEIKPQAIISKTNIDKIGNYKIDINLHSEVTATVNLQVKKLEAS